MVTGCDGTVEEGADANLPTDASVDQVTADASGDGASGPQQDGGQPGADAACHSHADCPSTQVTHPETACDPARGCVQLTTDECPLVIGDYQGTVAPPIVLGAFATIPASNPMGDPTYLNYSLAIAEFTNDGAGIPAGPGTGKRSPVVVVCNDEQPNQAGYDTAMQHLTGDLGVAVVVAPLPSGTLGTTFTRDAFPTKTLVINPLGADSTIVPPGLTTDGLLWHMLGQPSDWAPAYGSFFPVLESYVRGLHGLGSAPMKVAAVTSANSVVLADLADATKPLLFWNGQSLASNQTAGYYKDEGITDTVLAGANPNALDYSTVISDLVAFQPDVIVSFGSNEFVVMLENLEVSWPSGVPRPFYLLSPYNAAYEPLMTWIYGSCGGKSSTPQVCSRRFAGINAASTTDTADLSQYESAFLTYTMGQTQLLGAENFYDAMYFAVYSLVASGRMYEPTGAAASQGMLRLVALGAPEFHEGPADLGDVYGALGAGGNVSLYGPDGPPNFDLATGARVGQGDVYCIGWQDSGAPGYEYDVLRLGDEGGLYAPPGVIPCTDAGF